MTNANELREKELNDLMGVDVEVEEVALEDLIILGNQKKIPIHIIYPNDDGSVTKSKALVTQLTLKELKGMNLNGSNLLYLSEKLLLKSFFKTTGERFTSEELEQLPIGVIRAVSQTILKLSGIDPDDNRLQDF